MIGVIAKPDQTAVVKEFFELFKTPFEFYCPRREYNVVIATAQHIPNVSPRLLLIYGADAKSNDETIGVLARRRSSSGILNYEGVELPIYGELLTFEPGSGRACVMTASEPAGIQIDSPGHAVMRLGFDLFEEVRFLLSTGQPLQHAHIPALDLHIEMLRRWIVGAGLALVEIPPAPAKHSFCVCLTHDIDFVGIRNHKFDHTMWGFLYRCTAGALMKFVQGRLSFLKLLKSWKSALSLPLVYAGWSDDFWEPFAWYLKVEEGLPATYFLIPFQGRAGEQISAPHASRRAAGYDVSKLGSWTSLLQERGNELGVHGLDAWHSADKGREELARIAEISGTAELGIRMHWLLRNEDTFRVLEAAGYTYDSTVGYNETIGYRSGTAQVFRPLAARRLLELPLHIQDGALFYRNRLDLSEPEALKRCQNFIEHARKSGGVLTLLWHDRSHAPERFWGEFYSTLLASLRTLDGWFGSAAQVTAWFAKRRAVVFENVETTNSTWCTALRYIGEEITPPLNIRLHKPSHASGNSNCDAAEDVVDISWSGGHSDDLDRLLQPILVNSATAADQCLAASGRAILQTPQSCL